MLFFYLLLLSQQPFDWYFILLFGQPLLAITYLLLLVVVHCSNFSSFLEILLSLLCMHLGALALYVDLNIELEWGYYLPVIPYSAAVILTLLCALVVLSTAPNYKVKEDITRNDEECVELQPTNA